MNTNFAEVVEDVRQLSFEEKRDLKVLLDVYLIEEHRQEILQNGDASRLELENGEMTFSTNIKEMMETLNG